MYTARKDYVAAQAKPPSSGTGTGLSNSVRGYEGVFKSVVVYAHSSSTIAAVNIQGATIYSGLSTVAGFPLRNNDTTPYNHERKFFINTAGTNGVAHDSVWVSWEIVSDWYFIANGVGANWEGQQYYIGKYGTYSLHTDWSQVHTN
jgi:hypothetical protein